MGDYDECYDRDDYDDYQDTARDCIGWEEDMIKNIKDILPVSGFDSAESRYKTR